VETGGKGLWRTMKYDGYPEKMMRVLENTYKLQKTCSAVSVGGELTEWFSTIYRVVCYPHCSSISSWK